MTKLVILLSLGLLVGCSSASKKQSTETNAAPAATAMPAPVETKKEDSKKSKTTTGKATGEAKIAAEVTCSSHEGVRKLAIKTKDQGCELDYTKGGQTSAIASQVVGQAKCEEVSTRIQEKLIAAGYKCE